MDAGSRKRKIETRGEVAAGALYPARTRQMSLDEAQNEPTCLMVQRPCRLPIDLAGADRGGAHPGGVCA